MAKSKISSKRDKPVMVYWDTHKTLKKIAFDCEIAMERLVNKLLEHDVTDNERLKKALLELEADPKCLDEML